MTRNEKNEMAEGNAPRITPQVPALKGMTPLGLKKQPTRNVKIEGRKLTCGRTLGHRLMVDTVNTCDFITIKMDRGPEMYIDNKDAKQIAKFILAFVAEQEEAR